MQKNHYYPFGGSFADSYDSGKDQPYKYNGKELDKMHGLNMYDYSARYMDPAIGRFTTVDPLAEKYYSISPYVYCGNNPIKRIDPTGMWYDDYFNRDGMYLGTDNDPNSDQVRVMDDATWEANKTGDGTINHDVGIANSSLHSESGITTKASLAIFEHYNDTGAKLRNENGDFLMEYYIRSHSIMGITSEGISVNITTALKVKVSDNIYDIKNTFVHENKHKSDTRFYGVPKIHEISADILDCRAISTQVNHPTWEKVTPYLKGQVERYANIRHSIVPKANYNPLQPQMSAPLQIKRLR